MTRNTQFAAVPAARGDLFVAIVLTLLASAVVVLGWRVLWFLTDDAFIAFRYVSNSVLGHGYVWNAAPFRPVEGYTSFLWVALLDGIWRLFGAQPPAVANWITLALSIAAVALCTRMALRMSWSDALRPVRWVCLGLVLLAVTTNRTFLTWTSSGFETALFNLLFLVWLDVSVFTRSWRARQVVLLTASATLLALTRPDGLLYVLVTLVMLAAIVWRQASRARGRCLMAATPLLAVGAHVLWRHATYDLWLPNTYYAKVVAPWPAAGVRFVLSFVLEYALWFWPLVAVIANARGWRSTQAHQQFEGAGPFGWPLQSVLRLLAVGAIAAHVGYYALVVGGDHFEYRILSHLVVPIFVSFLWLLNRARIGPRLAVPCIAAFLLLSLPVPWTHWGVSRHLETRQETRRMRVPIAPHWPGAVRGYASAFDRVQSWLIERWICVRHQEHKVNQEYLTSLYPSREEGERLPRSDYPVHAFQAVGVASWTLPHVNIVDLLGLNDYVIARTPVPPTRLRGMAHERRAPEGYADCFTPNVFLRPGEGIRVTQRPQPLTADDIRACEETWAARVQRQAEARTN